MTQRYMDSSRDKNLNARTDQHHNPTGHRRSGSALKNTTQIIVICLVIAAFFGSYFLFASASMTTPISSDRKQVQQSHDVNIGHVVVNDGDNCRKRKFDNSTGAFKDDGLVPCKNKSLSGQNNQFQHHYSGNRLQEIRRGFSNRKDD